MNHANELYGFDLKTKKLAQLTTENIVLLSPFKESKVEKTWVTTTDNQQMLSWIIYPPDFDSTKKYPTLLYCQGGPQSALTQFFSFRWNFRLMAAKGYIVIAPNRRGMPGHGSKWNEQISKDWGGQVMQDYLSATDVMRKKSFVDTNRMAAVGASYGGYSVFMLASMHQGRFKSFISHCGVFNLQSMYGTTEEVFFTDFDLGGPYWEKENKIAQKAYTQFNPVEHVSKWNTPILIIQGGKDYRVPIGQGQEAFQAAQLRGIKSRFVYLPEENHWVLGAQNAMVWQKEYFKWLSETL
jgi:dipeptidyl aminopeptidase/acylaminoacyl peptidase